MNLLPKNKAIVFLYIASLAVTVIFIWFFYHSKQNETRYSGKQFQKISLSDGGLFFEMPDSRAESVGKFLEEQKIKLNEKDFIFPPLEAKINSGMEIFIARAKKISVLADNAKKNGYVFANTIGQALGELGINFREEDIIIPEENAPVKNNTEIKITRVDIKEETKTEPIKFETTTKEDDKLGWREKKIEQKGQNGKEEIKYKVVYHNGKEISRKILERKTILEPTKEIVVQGTYVKTGKARTGQGTWYAWKGGLFAASTTLPKGSYAKVTNTENGKTVIVQINDYGPQGKGRIIDLDKVAFAKIANIGTGVIGVKVEQVLN
jgi:rare lipoprotein A (peptidoglycan hydrolase)